MIVHDRVVPNLNVSFFRNSEIISTKNEALIG